MGCACKCDACGTLYEPWQMAVPDVTIRIYRHPYGEDRVDLCRSCQKKLEDFIHYIKEDDDK